MRNLILSKRQARFIEHDLVINLCRAFMLTSSLKLVGHYFLHPIFVSTCGVTQSILAIYKTIRSKKTFASLTQDDVSKRKAQ
jgi:hypothetical protein